MAEVDTDDAISALLRLEFDFFLRMAFHELGGHDAYMHNWHIDAIVHQLDRIRSGENQRLIVTMPPRHLKSRILSIAWVAWMLGHNPALTFLCVTYGQSLSEDHAADCLRIMQSRWYTRAFPNTVLASRAVAYLRTTAGGGRMASSVEGATTGFGADIIIVDDPLKAQDALSVAAREAANRWFDETLSQRLNSQMTGAIIVTMQRLHEADLVGTLKKQGGYHELCLPAIATQDELVPLTRGRFWRRRAGCALHAARHSLDRLKARQAASPYVFAGQFQQDPIPGIGNIIEASWLRTYEASSIDLTQGQIVMSLDTASKDNPFNDYSAIVVARVLGKSVHIIDVFRARLKLPALELKTIELARLHNASVLLIEDAVSGMQLIQRLQAEEPAGVPLPIPRRPKGDKNSRVLGASVMIQAGRLFVPDQGHWVSEFTAELLGFPGAAFDDQVDATSQLLLWVQEKDTYRVPMNEGPILITEEDDWEDYSDQYPSNYDPWSGL
ncbi:phage terminase large subunit [Sphingomonas piscis]|uniref:Phage terminase large subunit n=1 Tax=Sphingomonas piscis TaxID=2714943 RepID=A0A6G7YQX0_9SPHN|nr:phage terminase large subunit [Sphingomonas piscis]QIK79133.1 phage terminase large subunit [Sphingomonas piscis]